MKKENDGNNTRKKKNIIVDINYNSKDGMQTSIWGPSMWHCLHTMSFNYPANPTLHDKKKYQQFIFQLKNVLPCGKCRENLKKNFTKLPLTISNMKSRESFSKYIYNLHELINTMLHKKSHLSYDQVRERYEKFRARCYNTSKLSLLTKNNNSKHKKEENKENKNKEKGCTEPMYGTKAKCVLRIVDKNKKCDTFQID